MSDITPEKARHYIKTFLDHTLTGMTYVDFPSGRIYINDMTDDQAIKVAYGLMDIEQQAAKGIPRQ